MSAVNNSSLSPSQQSTPKTPRMFHLSGNEGDPFHSSAISPLTTTGALSSSVRATTAPQLQIANDLAHPRTASLLLSSEINESAIDDNDDILSSPVVAPLVEKLRRYSIEESTFYVLDSIDPTFWSLETYIQTCTRISSDSKEMLPFSYYASLMVTKQTDKLNSPETTNYYYDKLCFIRYPLKMSTMLSNALGTVQRWLNDLELYLEEDGNSGQGSVSSMGSAALSSSTSSKSSKSSAQRDTLTFLQDLKNTISKFLFIMNQLDNSNGDVECYQSCNWPNGSSTARLIKYFPEFGLLLPLRSTSEKALICMDAFLPQLEGLMGQIHNPFERAYFYKDVSRDGETWWMRLLMTKVEQWQQQQEAPGYSPRKRSFTAMDNDVIGHFRRPSDSARGRPKRCRRSSIVADN
ncbi:hypothetical protein BON22_3865 [Cyberlindnera fabianii]|uniref:Uncharacterized protein n=1 Tax=Cyberlindnera fabianii TaxID=36022 RepID=A0A1V2L324_CYBFA|nr:hypothetical protein BON22_3865 [Cyberlindnera fabianii]